MKCKVGKLDVDNLLPGPTNVKMLSDVVKKEVVKKDVYDEFVKEVNVIDNSGLVYDARINEIKGGITSITGFATTAAHNDIKNVISNFSILVKQTDYDAKIKDIESRYFTTSDHNKSKKSATKAESKAEKDKIVKLQTYDSSLFIGQSYLSNDKSQSFLIFQLIYKTCKMSVGLSAATVEWEYKGLWNENIKPCVTANL